MPIGTELLKQAQEYKPNLIDMYRYLHRHPETAHHEVQTNRYIRARLDEMGVSYLAPAENITIALIDSGKAGATVGLRCDTDALPVQEETGLSYASETEGVMHACGHDAHIVNGLGAARLLIENADHWRGKVKLIFQPAEEGEAGAQDVIRTGLVDDVDVFFGIHVWSPYASGEIHVSPVTVSATVDMFRIVIKGKGGHGATPEKCCDAVVAGSALVMSLQTVVSRRISPMDPALLTVGSFHAGTVGNIIAQEAKIKGTFRSLKPEVRKAIYDHLVQISHQVAESYGCTAEVYNRCLSDAVINDEKASRIAQSSAAELVGAERVYPQHSMMLGDDFADYGAIAPYCYGQVGIADSEKETDYAHHNGKFRMDEDVLPLCAAWMALTAMKYGSEWRK